MTEILNVDDNLNKIKEAIEFNSKRLNLSQTETTIIDQNGMNKTFPHKKAIEELFKLAGSGRMNGHISVVCKNLFKIISDIEIRMNTASKKIEEKIIDLVEIIEKVSQSNEQLEDELLELEKNNEILNIKLETLQEDRHRTEIDDLKSQIKLLTLNAMGTNNIENQIEENNPDSYFDINSNNNNNSIIEDKISNINIEKKKKQSIAHQKMLEILKEENLLPIHKIDIKEAKHLYLENWQYIAPACGLDENDYPIFINNLERYKNKPDDYFNDLSNLNDCDRFKKEEE